MHPGSHSTPGCLRAPVIGHSYTGSIKNRGDEGYVKFLTSPKNKTAALSFSVDHIFSMWKGKIQKLRLWMIKSKKKGDLTCMERKGVCWKAD